MSISTPNILTLTGIQDAQIRSLISYVLLFLVSISFIVEHIPFVESDILELVESTEKEKDAKDKKLLLLSHSIFDVSKLEQSTNSICAYINTPLEAISMDILTPPPEFC